MILVIEPNPDTRSSIVDRLPDPEPIAEVDSLEEAEETTERLAASISCLVLGPSLERTAALAFAEKVGQRGAIGALLVAPTLESQVLREALRAGVDDVLTLDAETGEWEESIARARSRAASERQHRRVDEELGPTRGRLVSVFSTKGGCGKSVVATNLAVLSRERTGQPVGLVDLDLQSGDMAIMLQLMPALSVYDAAQSVHHLDAEAMQGYLTPHSSGVSLLAAPMEPSLADQVTATSIQTILELLRSIFPLTIVDGPPLFTDQMLAALDVSDEIVLVGSMDVPSIKNLKMAIRTLQQLGHPRDRLRVVMNRADSKVGLRSTEVEKSLGVEIDVEIPSSRDVPLSINQGTPLAISRPKSPVVAAIAELVPELVSVDEDTGERGRFRRRR